MSSGPVKLSPEQQKVVDHRGGHLQVIACAGSGKTESVSRHIASLVADGEDPGSIVAFTFTERAAEELKARILTSVVQACGDSFKGRLAALFVGTIHSYCFHLLQNHVPRYGNFDVLDPNRHAGLLSREMKRLDLKKKLETSKHWAPIAEFTRTVDVIGNELIPASALAGTPLGEVYVDYLATLDRYHYLTFSRIIQDAVAALDEPQVFEAVHGPLRHLVVDEYQDINPAQGALIRKLAQAPVQLCVVGDDDQSIYQWRGSDVSHIVGFKKSHAGAKSITLAKNRRSVGGIVELASGFATTIPGRLPKKMTAHRPGLEGSEVVPWSAETPPEEAAIIASTILRLKEKGFRFRDIAVLFRSVRNSAPVLIEELRQRDIPYSCGGRTGLFLQPEVDLLARAYHWLVDFDWRPPGYGEETWKVTPDELIQDLRKVFETGRSKKELRSFLDDWKEEAQGNRRPANLVGDLYRLLQFVGVHTWDPDVPERSARMGSLARFSTILADFENVARRGRFVDKDGERTFQGGTDRGPYYYQRLASFLRHYASEAYEEFEGEDSVDLDAVDILTVHGAKGLEWPVVFLPSLTSRRFPSSMAGRNQDWLLPENVFPAEARRRYQGGDSEERRLFYVAMTRARDRLYLSHFRRQKNRASPSPYLLDLFGEDTKALPDLAELPIPDSPPPPRTDERPAVTVSFSELSSFDDCGFRYRLSSSLGFETQLVSELGYGRAVHHVLRQVAETARRTGKIPTKKQTEQLFEQEFYLPFANAVNFTNLRNVGWKLVERYLKDYHQDLTRIWATERPFELHLEHGLLTGRADVILDHHDGKPDSYAIVDYKTVRGHERDEEFEHQLRVYTAAARAEGLSVEAAYLHHLDESERTDVLVGGKAVAAARKRVTTSMKKLRERVFVAQPEEKKCGGCEYRNLCRHAPVDPWEAD